MFGRENTSLSCDFFYPGRILSQKLFCVKTWNFFVKTLHLYAQALFFLCRKTILFCVNVKTWFFRENTSFSRNFVCLGRILLESVKMDKLPFKTILFC